MLSDLSSRHEHLHCLRCQLIQRGQSFSTLQLAIPCCLKRVHGPFLQLIYLSEVKMAQITLVLGLLSVQVMGLVTDQR